MLTSAASRHKAGVWKQTTQGCHPGLSSEEKQSSKQLYVNRSQFHRDIISYLHYNFAKICIRQLNTLKITRRTGFARFPANQDAESTEWRHRQIVEWPKARLTACVLISKPLEWLLSGFHMSDFPGLSVVQPGPSTSHVEPTLVKSISDCWLWTNNSKAIPKHQHCFDVKQQALPGKHTKLQFCLETTEHINRPWMWASLLQNICTLDLPRWGNGRVGSGKQIDPVTKLQYETYNSTKAGQLVSLDRVHLNSSFVW